MKTAKASKPAGTPGGSSGTASPKPVKSWSKIASGGQGKGAAQDVTRELDESSQGSREKMLNVLSSLVNTEADVTTKSGAKYRGQVKSVGTSGDAGIVLKGAKVVNVNATNGNNGSSADVEIKGSDVSEVFAAKLNLRRPDSTSASENATQPKAGAWKTDTDISGKGQIRERVLQAWQPPPDEEGFSIEDDLSSTRPASSGKKWDQFAANEQLFGVKSQWDEDVYTHKLDTSRPDFAQRQAEAERLAREIEQSGSSNPHVLEERGVVDDSGLTEEDKYSGVHRNPNAWQPPARRPVANLPVARGSQPVDPAIISSQLAKPSGAGHKSAQSVATPSTPDQAAKDPSAAGKKPSHPIEADIMARFKQFATSERDRLSVKKAATFKKEKDGRLQDLLAFSKDFKLTTPVPEDLIPILAKDKAKQEAIVQKAASSAASSPSVNRSASPSVRPAETKLADTLRSRVDNAHAAKSPDVTATPIAAAKPQTPEVKKLKPSATEFKPFNPAASSFTPSFAQRAPQTASPALSTTSSQPRQTQFSADAASFFPKKLPPSSERAPLLDQFNPFKTYKAKHPESALDIEAPLKVDPSWPGDESQSIMDPPQDTRRPPQIEEQYQAPQMQYPQAPAMMFIGSPQQPQGFQPSYYGGKNNQYMSMPPGQFVPYQAGAGFVPPQYMFQNAQGYGPRVMQPHMVPVPYSPQQFNGYSPQMGSPMSASGFSNHNQGSPRPRQGMPAGQQRSPEMSKNATRPPPMSAEPPKEP